MMVEANNQEYAFNFLQQSLKNKIQDAEVLGKSSMKEQSAADHYYSNASDHNETESTQSGLTFIFHLPDSH